VTYEKDPRVDAYIDALLDWQQTICREVRDLVHAGDPEVQETIKRRVQPYFVLEGNICALLAAKDHVNVSTTAGSSPTRRASSRAAKGTRRPVPSRSERVRKSTPERSSGSSSRSSPTTARAPGGS
jgi:hypothetical protein